MVSKTGPTSTITRELIADLRSLATKEKVNIWKRVANELSKSTRARRSVNLYRINKHIRVGEIALIPGKVLSEGEYTKNNTVAAFQFSELAKEKISSKAKAISIRQLIKDNPKGKKVRILC